MASICALQFHGFSQHSIWSSSKHIISSPNTSKLSTQFGFNYIHLSWGESRSVQRFLLRAVNSPLSSDVDQSSQDAGKKQTNKTLLNVEDLVGRFQGKISSKNTFRNFHTIVSSFPPAIFAFAMKRHIGSSYVLGLFVATAFVVVAVRVYVARKLQYSHSGSVADLVRRGQLRSDRRGISSPLKYEDPFNNPLVKVGKGNSTIEMCGKVYRLAPVTLTEDQQVMHQKRRSRAYRWKRPTIFLKEGDSVPPDVDPETIRWIPANHPFATTVSVMDEDLAQNNVYQKHGVPFRIQAEHEALQRKLEALQNEQKFNKVVIDSSSAKDYERPFKSNSKLYEHTEQSSFNNHSGNSLGFKSDQVPISPERNIPPEQAQ